MSRKTYPVNVRTKITASATIWIEADSEDDAINQGRKRCADNSVLWSYQSSTHGHHAEIDRKLYDAIPTTENVPSLRAWAKERGYILHRIAADTRHYRQGYVWRIHGERSRMYAKSGLEVGHLINQSLQDKGKLI